MSTLQEKFQELVSLTASHQLAHICNRMFLTLQGECVLRAPTEELILASDYKPHDPLAAKFIRMFRHRYFPGKVYVDKCDALASGAANQKVTVMLPRAIASAEVPDQVAFHGFRNTHNRSLSFFRSGNPFVQTTSRATFQCWVQADCGGQRGLGKDESFQH